MSARPAATRADSSDSIAASAATVSAGSSRVLTSAGSIAGREGAGSECGSAPIRASGVGTRTHSSVTTMMPTRDPGIAEWRRGASTMMSATSTAAPTAHGTYDQSAAMSAWPAATIAFELCSPGSTVAPEKSAGTCCMKMMTAIPRVKPSMTGQGMKDTERPSRRAPAMSTMRPARRLTVATAATPCCATIGSSTTTIAPVGPETCTFEPPKTAAMMPATIAVMSPASALTPELTPKPRASGSATMPTVTPATRSDRQVDRSER